MSELRNHSYLRLGEGKSDFLIQTSKEHGFKNLVNLFGMESPGLTSSLVIADYVSSLLD